MNRVVVKEGFLAQAEMTQSLCDVDDENITERNMQGAMLSAKTI